MGLVDWFRPTVKAEAVVVNNHSLMLQSAITAKSEVASAQAYGGARNQGIEVVYSDGEKNVGQMGPPIHYVYNYESVRVRGRQLYNESDIAKTFINNYVEWICGAGLKMQAEPMDDVINAGKGTKFDKKKFIREAESRFRLHMESRFSTHSNNISGQLQFRSAVLEAIIEGDCLIVDRVKNGYPTIDVISGRKVKSPGYPHSIEIQNRGNKEYEGVEIDKNGTHVAFYVQNDDWTFTRIEAIGKKTGRKQASLMYGIDLPVGAVRGLPIMIASFENIKNCTDLIGSAVSGAVKAANMAVIVEHNHFSTGEGLSMQGMIEAANAGEPKDQQLESYGTIDELKRNVVAMGADQLVNAPIGATVKTIPATSNTNISGFLESVLIPIGASTGLPYEMAMMVFKNSFSASRMSANSALQIFLNRRALYTPAYYGMAYEIFVELEVLFGRITATGFMDAILSNDHITKEAYLKSRYVGPRPPQADPAKEMKGIILAIQHGLKTHEQAAEEIGGSDYYTNIETLGDEYKEMMKLFPKEFLLPTNAETSTAEFGKEPKVKEPKESK